MDMLAAVHANSAPASAFLWRAAAPALVLPERFARGPGFADVAAARAAEGWPVTTRKTGGGITPQGPGVVNLALAFRVPPPRSRDIRGSYDAICSPLIAALAALGLRATAAPITGSFCDGDHNLAVAGRKIAGTAQRWRGNACLAHALILTDLDLAPAVAAVARLSAGLGHDTEFRPDRHSRLADLLASPANLPDRLATQVHKVLAAQGYTPWAPTPARP